MLWCGSLFSPDQLSGFRVRQISHLDRERLSGQSTRSCQIPMSSTSDSRYGRTRQADHNRGKFRAFGLVPSPSGCLRGSTAEKVT